MRLMIKKIILFTKGIETLWYFSEQLGKELEILGYDVFYFDQQRIPELERFDLVLRAESDGGDQLQF